MLTEAEQQPVCSSRLSGSIFRREIIRRSPGLAFFAIATCAFAPALVYGFIAWLCGVPPGHVFLGYLHPDLNVYYANSREIFENGNGLFYANASSNLPDSPRIYSHFLFLLIGYAWKFIDLSFTQIGIIMHIAGGTAMFVLLLALTLHLSWSVTRALLLFLLIAWSSGVAYVFAASGMAIDAAAGIEPLPGAWNALADEFVNRVHRAEIGYGQWEFSFLRVLLIPTHIPYHILVFGAAIAALTARFWIAVGLLFLTWWAHPYTGLQLGFTLATYLLFEIVISKKRTWRPFAAVILTNLLFLGYNLLFLSRFPEHQSVYRQMTNYENRVTLDMMFRAYGVLLVLPLLYLPTPLFLKRFKKSRAERFALALLICTLLLMFHYYLPFVSTNVQPAHFNQGYLIIPIAYFAFSGLARLLAYFRQRGRRIHLKWAALAIVILQSPDNLFWMINHPRSLPSALFSLPERDFQILNWLDGFRPQILQLQASTLDPNSYLLVPVHTKHRVAYGQETNTPEYDKKRTLTNQFMGEPSIQIARQLHLDSIVVDEEDAARIVNSLPAGSARVLGTKHGVALVGIDRETRSKNRSTRHNPRESVRPISEDR